MTPSSAALLDSTSPILHLAHGLEFAELYASEGLAKLDQAFLAALTDDTLKAQLLAARAAAPDAKEESFLIFALAPHLEHFLGHLFGVEQALESLVLSHKELDPLYSAKRLFVQRRAAKAYPAKEAVAFDGAAMKVQIEAAMGEMFSEPAFARHALIWMESAEAPPILDTALRFAAWASADGAFGEHSILFEAPKKLDPEHLVEARLCERGGVEMLAHANAQKRRLRQGFGLTDPGADLAHALDETNYCIYCHHQGRDSCSKGFKEKDGAWKKNPLGITLAGCPLEEHISEMNELKSKALPLAALAAIVINNPMCAGTGHRICNDCMKACVYQKQEPVDIPQAETRTLKDVLGLPWGFEIYSLLTRWNPLNFRVPFAKPFSGKRVLVAGMGPAGYTLAHHLMNDGHQVVGVEGLKVEPLSPMLSGVEASGARIAFSPVFDASSLHEPLETRVGQGFGGVAEYGITVRWDKNFLTLLRLLLERRAEFTLMGSIRFGSALTVEQAWDLGFDHIALCMGAGGPTVIDMPNALARGVRTASDFLMALQLTGAGREDSLANLQLRLPVAVIGGGLTAVDAATEALAYYSLQVEKFAARHETLVDRFGEAQVQARWSAEDHEIATEFLAHAAALRNERAMAAEEKRLPNIGALLDAWGGATLVYRKRLIDAPSYRLNHEEVEKAFEEGMFFAELWEPAGVELDAYGAANGLTLAQAGGDKRTTLPARTILMAAGTRPNTVLAREDGAIALHGNYFQAVDDDAQPVSPERNSKPNEVRVLMSRRADGRAMSFFGDLHPSFAGNVVKAMGSAKQGWPVVSRMLNAAPARRGETVTAFDSLMRARFSARVHEVRRLTPTIVEVVLHAPAAAEAFEPGQFYRLQNYEALARRVALPAPTRLAMEPLAMTGAWVDKEAGLLSVIALEMGGSSNLCALLQPGEPVALMGPTGMPTHIPEHSTVMLVGGGLGNAVLFSIGQAARAKGSRVLYFAGYKALADRYKVESIEAAADVIVWACDEAPGFVPTRPQDKSFVGNIVAAMAAYGRGELGEMPIPMHEARHAIVIGSDRMMQAVGQARHNILKPYLGPHEAVGSINSPMQCMMKEICAQCLQRHVDPVTGEERFVYSCFNQDQALDAVDFEFLNQRLKQNSLSEKLTTIWIRALLDKEFQSKSLFRH